MKRKSKDPFKGPAHKIFNEGAGQKTGVWNGAGTTRTAANSTLFVANIAPPVSMAQVEELFQREPGFFSFRTVRRMAFVDFSTVPHANLAMRKHQHHHFPEWGENNEKKLLIDYDKDPRAKRNKQFEKQYQQQVTLEDKNVTRIFCGACATFCVSLKIPPPKEFSTLPRRKTDGNVVVNSKKYLKIKRLTKGAVTKIKRDGGIEVQYRWQCGGCGIPVAYQSEPHETGAKHILLITTAIVESKDGPPSLQHMVAGVGGGEETEEEDAELLAEMEKVREEMRVQREEEEAKKEAERLLQEKKKAEIIARRAKAEEERERKEKLKAQQRTAFFEDRATALHAQPTGKMKDTFTQVFQAHGPANE